MYDIINRNFLLKGFYVDLRSLGLLRIGIGFILTVDLLLRIVDIPAFYSDNGMFPRIAAYKYLSPYTFSLHTANGTAMYISLLFITQIMCSIFLMIGYKTKWVSIFSWILFVSLLNRNPYVMFGADNVMLIILFVGMFLPWNMRFAIDSYHKHKNDNIILSFSTSAYVLTIAMIYGFAGAFKINPMWLSGTALQYALADPYYKKPFADFLLAMPNVVHVLNYGTILWEISIPFWITFPYKNHLIRIVMLIGLFLFHLGIDMNLSIGLFSTVEIIAISGLIPSVVWDKIETLKAFTLLREKVMLLVDKIFFLFQTNPLTEVKETKFTGVIGLLLIIYCISLNTIWLFHLNSNFFNYDLPAKIFSLNTKWDVYHAPNKNYYWLNIEAIDIKGKHFNYLTGTDTIDFTIPTYDTWFYQNHRWKKYMINIYRTSLTNEFTQYLCSSWNTSHDRKIKTLYLYLSNGKIILPKPTYKYISTKKLFIRNCR